MLFRNGNQEWPFWKPIATIGDATMVDVQPTENMTIDPPPGANDMPLMGNPILMRTSGRTRPSGVRTSGSRNSGSRASGSRSGWQVALPVAAVVVIAGAAGAYFFAKSSQTQPLTTTAPAASAASAPATEPPPAVASTAAPTAAAISPTEKPVAPEAAPRHERVTRLARAERTERHAAVRHARAAGDEGADVSATAPIVAPAPAPSAPPVITPPPAQ
jgi:cytoskeletal protein RodZ